MIKMSEYKISGKERRELKKTLRHLNSAIQNFWIHYDFDTVYGTHIGTKEDYEKQLEDLKQEREELANRLNEKVDGS